MNRRSVLKGAVAAGLTVHGALGRPGPATRPQADPGRIARENRRPGTRDWMLIRTRIDPPTRFRCPWIEGYCSRVSLKAGDTLDLHVSTNPPSPFTVDIYRLGYYGGAGARHVRQLGPFEGRVQPDPPVGEQRLRACRWEPCTSIRIPGDWLSGVYLGKLTAQGEGLQSYVIFIVRDDRPADFNFQCSTHTWQAYNRWPDQFALYDDGHDDWYWGPGVRVSCDRPYARYCQILDQPLSTGSGEFLLWEFPLAYWMEQHGYDVTYTSNVDTHADPAQLRRTKGWLSVGHDEYWTMAMLKQVKAAVASGVSAAFFSGNTACGVIESLPGVARRPDRVIGRIGLFGRPRDFLERLGGINGLPFVGESEATLIGARSTDPVTGGGDWRCTKPEHWIFENTGMKAGDAIPGLVGWEWHGDPADIPGLEIVSEGPTTSPAGAGHYTATIYPGPRGNFVFNASTIWWADGLSEPPGYMRPKVYTEPRGPDPRVQQITRNILERIRRQTLRAES